MKAIGLRGRVIGKRRPFKEDGLDLDLSYICKDRIIVMGFPQAGVKAGYRNNWKDIRQFLESRHKDHYKVYNLSETTYAKSRFNDRVEEFAWQDHHAPPFNLLMKLVSNMVNFLKSSPINVVLIHCNSGKGRAGTAATCLLYFLGLFP